MVLRYLTLLISIYSARSITTGTLSGYYSSSDINSIVSSLLRNDSLIVTRTPSINGFSLSSNSNKSLPKQKVLIIGGFFGGFPQGNYQVLYTAQSIISEYNSINTSSTILDNLILDFAPNINPLAYSKSENLFKNTSSFNVSFYGDQNISAYEGLLTCNLSDVGINPDQNFLYKFNQLIRCTNFTGQFGNTSRVITPFYNSLENYSLVINYQGNGEYYAISPCFSEGSADSKIYNYFTSNFAGLLSQRRYRFGTMYSVTGNDLRGTLIDTVSYDYKKVALQIGLGPYGSVTSNLSLSSESYFHYSLLRDNLLFNMCGIKIGSSSYTEGEYKCDNSPCNFSVIVIDIPFTYNGVSQTNLSLLFVIRLANSENIGFNNLSVSYNSKSDLIFPVVIAALNQTNISSSNYTVSNFAAGNIKLCLNRTSRNYNSTFGIDYYIGSSTYSMVVNSSSINILVSSVLPIVMGEVTTSDIIVAVVLPVSSMIIFSVFYFLYYF